jgi:hypothetical protein
MAQGEAIRQELAVYLHGKHERTSNVGQSRRGAGAGWPGREDAEVLHFLLSRATGRP